MIFDISCEVNDVYQKHKDFFLNNWFELDVNNLKCLILIFFYYNLTDQTKVFSEVTIVFCFQISEKFVSEFL